ncbi:probable F-box protein At2g36090 [Abrus precatorius]|uniref:Probable F-box protein At2g36090 n=1 Tax=Abrus precatorius TaxID=3816 RepID=A0A8B8MHB9_ABRPR|nr:probable F-box protein At2g36090 [Abrus precatorius]
MTSTSDEPTEAATGDRGGATSISDVHPDIIQTHILTRLDGPTLASAATTSSELHTLSADNNLWANACHSTWPSTISPRVHHVISTFPNGPRSFFADSFPSSRPSPTAPTTKPHRTPQLISAVDLFHGDRLLFSKVVETETGTGWFRCSPFRIDLVDPKDVVRTRLKYPVDEDTCKNLGEELKLSWIVIDPTVRRAVNVSSFNAVSVNKHWLSGEVEVRFATVVDGERGTAREVVLCSVTVTWGEEMQVREVSLQMEDMDGMQMNGRDCLVILLRALEGERKRKKKEEGCDYRAFVRKKKERMERKVRAEGRLDMLCVGLALFSTFSALFLLFRWK